MTGGGRAGGGKAGGDRPRVGFIGLGSQGGPMARRIIEAGFPATLWARRPETLAPYAGTAAATAGSPAELGTASDIACVCVVDDAGVEEVVAGPKGLLDGDGMRPGGLIVIHSTVHPDTCVRLAERAAERGVALIDAPVSGGGPAAETGKLLVMVGGDAGAAERAKPVFAAYGDPVVHLGPLGAAQRAKLVNNVLFAAHLGVALQAFALAQSLDIDPAGMSTVLEHGSGRSYGAGVVAGMGFTLDPLVDIAGPLLQKDARLVAELARAAGTEPAGTEPAGTEPAGTEPAGTEAGSMFAAVDDALRSLRHPR
ncbi:NAD(P)-dependent oxidoreductase [Actinomadura sp. 7K507]|uniref:NAD(P)-dependent oxidoreductase n=1 Tax=Actinomadura sp. 7K507 TaxID=2530365 RepID=UPI00104E4B7B|nr:NAD(P)-dependent oxidoreductase [Actinomadura sp. 7K507]TDC85091.1 NAD(P)-dependent oxidoreductase [Actinomadura sp. 7K507]